RDLPSFPTRRSSDLIRVDRADVEPEGPCVRLQVIDVVDLVPGNVQGDRARDTGQATHDGGVLELLERVARRTRLWKDGEAGARAAERPRRHLDVLRAQRRFDVHVVTARGRTISVNRPYRSSQRPRWASGSYLSRRVDARTISRIS